MDTSTEAIGHGHGSPWQRLVGWVIGCICAPAVLWLFSTAVTTSTRTAVLEAQYQRIETKLDQLLDRPHPHGSK